MRRAVPPSLLCAAAVALFAGSLLRHLSLPLFWHDEGDTAMFATRILEEGYPKVHGARNVLYESGAPLSVGVKESADAYIGKTWGDFYFAVPGVWWAQGSQDPHVRTLRVRLPFALAGAAGVGVWLWGVLPALPGGRRERLRFAAAYFTLCTLSISLVLHLREARYYSLLVLVLGALVAAHLRHVVLHALSRRCYALATAGLGALLFHVFFAAWIPVLGLLGADAAQQAWRAGPEDGRRWGRIARALLPIGSAVLLTLPALWFFETFGVSLRFARDVGAGPGVWLANLRDVLAHFLRHEWLLAALVTRAAAASLSRLAPDAARDATRAARASSSRLLVFVAGYSVFGCVNPLVYERYFVALSPALTLAFLLDVVALRTLLSSAPRAGRRAGILVLGLLVASSLALRRDALAGRVAELRTPMHGPLDHVVAHLRERYPDPASLRIATNYEAQPLMFYLDSRVIVGLALGDIARERALEPDVVIPRRRWPRSLAELRPFLARGRWQEQGLPVLDTHYNNVPSLSPSPTTPDPHRFETPGVAPDAPGALRVFHRLRSVN